jgi:DNA-binding NtrC family response regulator
MGQRGVTPFARLSRDERRRKLALLLASCEGNVKRAAHFLGISRGHMYRMIHQFRLYPLINEARRVRAIDAKAAKGLEIHNGISSN